MRERDRARHRSRDPEATGVAHGPAPREATSTATVAHGPYAEQLPVAGLTVGQIRSRYRDRFDIDPDSEAVLDGDPVRDDEILGPDQVLTFIRKAGEKGRRQRSHQWRR